MNVMRCEREMHSVESGTVRGHGRRACTCTGSVAARGTTSFVSIVCVCVAKERKVGKRGV